jgi:hypothetical protein
VAPHVNPEYDIEGQAPHSWPCEAAPRWPAPPFREPRQAIPKVLRSRKIARDEDEPPGAGCSSPRGRAWRQPADEPEPTEAGAAGKAREDGRTAAAATPPMRLQCATHGRSADSTAVRGCGKLTGRPSASSWKSVSGSRSPCRRWVPSGRRPTHWQRCFDGSRGS